MNSKKLSIGSDHGGFTLKQELVKRLQADGFEVDDKGPANTDSVDYPDYALKVCEDVVNGKSDFGVLVCTTGIGMSMSANKFHGIRAAVCHMESYASAKNTTRPTWPKRWSKFSRPRISRADGTSAA